MADNKNLKFLSSLQFPDTAEYIIDAKYVGGFKADDLISMINSAMIFRGTLSSDSTMSPTITELPTPTKDTIGDVYKVISDGEYDYDNNKYSIAAKNGDIFVAVGRKEEDTDINGNPVINYLDLGWVLVPSGNDFSAIFIGCDNISDGSAGLVPAPAKGEQDKFLKADGTWAVPTENYYDKDEVNDIVEDYVIKSLENYHTRDEVNGIVDTLARREELKGYVATSSLETEVNAIIKKTVGLYTGDTEPTEDLNADDVWISSAGVKIYQITTDENNTEVRRWKDVAATSDPNNILDSDDITKLKLLLSTITLETADSNTNENTEGTPTEGTT